MKRILIALALLGALFAIAMPLQAQEKAATPPTATTPVPKDDGIAPPTSAPQTTPAPAAAASTAAPTTPQVVSADKISTGDTAWMLSSTGLVLMMTIPGLALFYGGMVRKKNVLATLMQSFSITCLVTILWVVVGYSLAFMPGNGVFGGMGRFFLNGMVLENEAGKVS
ncbi:MAG TPA: ammonia channel protein, partial [Rhodanobacteraceae bacterium]